jgi:hypothetical protein
MPRSKLPSHRFGRGHDHDIPILTATTTVSEAHIHGNGHLPAPPQHDQTTKGASPMTGKEFVDSLSVAQLTDLRDYIDRRIVHLADTAVLRDIVADQRVHPQQHNPHVSGSYESVERAHRVAEARAAERLALAEARTRRQQH